jgi:hypothetical protein
MCGQREPILLAGVTGEWSGGTGGVVELHDLRIGGKPIDPAKEYICTANDYIIGEAPRYLGMTMPGVIYSGLTLFATVEEAIRKDREIVPVVLPTLTRSH